MCNLTRLKHVSEINEEDEEGLSFVLLHGSWLDRRCWYRVVGELGARGHRGIATTLDPSAPLEDQAYGVAKTIRRRLKDSADITIVGHSRSANVIPRVIKHLGEGAVKRLIIVAGSLLPETIGGYDGPPHRNYPWFVDAIDIDETTRMSTIDPEKAKDILFNKTEAEIANCAIRRLRPYRRGAEESRLAQWPDVKTYYLRPEDDNVIRPEWVDAIAPKINNAEVVEIPGDHCPMLSKPVPLTRAMINIAKNNGSQGAADGPVHLPRQLQSSPQSTDSASIHSRQL